MKNSLLVIKGRNESFSALVTEAMGTAFPGARVQAVDSLAAAETLPHSGGADILVLIDSSREEVAKARDILDGRKLPRWAVVACDGDLATGNWTPALAPHLLATAWASQAMRREIATLRGNLRSLGTRVAHDMRTPLGGVLAAAESLREGIAESDPESVVWLDNIIESEEDLLKLVRHQTMLAEELSRPVEVSEFDMGAAVAGALECLEGKLTLSKSEVSKPSEWPTVRGDRRKYERVWNLLVDNSVRHGGAGRKIKLSWEKSADSLKFWVSNDGPALAPDKQLALFRPFHRLHEPNSGKGLSLSLMEELVHAQGGISGYELAPDGNPTFYFTVVV
jgi:signal transduction histidine kinase